MRVPSAPAAVGVSWARCVKYRRGLPLLSWMLCCLCADKLSQPKRKPFFEKHHEAIFYVFLTSFTGSETHFQSKGEPVQLVTVHTLVCVSTHLSIPGTRRGLDAGFAEFTSCVLPTLEVRHNSGGCRGGWWVWGGGGGGGVP